MLVTSQLPYQTTKFYLIFLTCTCALHFEKGSTTHEHNHSSVHLTTKTTALGRSGRIIDGMRSSWMTLRDSVCSSPTSARILLEWPFKGQPGSGWTASGPPPLLTQTVYGLFCGLWLWPTRTNPRPCLQCRIHLDLSHYFTIWWVASFFLSIIIHYSYFCWVKTPSPEVDQPINLAKTFVLCSNLYFSKKMKLTKTWDFKCLNQFSIM